MSTYGEKVLNQIAEIESYIRNLAITGYDQDQIKNSISQVAALVELHLKRDFFPEKSNKDSLISFIDKLDEDTSDTFDLSSFHTIRKLYNKAKHDPYIVIDLSEAIDTVSYLRKTLEKVHELSIGQISTPVRQAAKRIFWVCAWDHLIHNETEITIFLPSSYDGYLGAHSIDCIHIKALDWGKFKSDLVNFGKVHPYEEWIPNGQTDFWFSEGDCLTPIVFEGEYKALLVCAARYKSNKVGRLAGLNRTDTSQYLFQSCVLGVIDHIDDINHMSTKVDNIVNTVINEYAVETTETDRVSYFVKQITNLIDSTPIHLRYSITGPYWVTPDEIESLDKYSFNKDIHSAIDKQNRFVLGVREL
tara:strand:- start:7679 stop:8758 length:1080 start_codon:yes stop_codon:yes gene_type:complete